MATMTAMPAGLSFLAAMASQYPNLQKAMNGVPIPGGATNQTGFQLPQLPASATSIPAVTQPQQIQTGQQQPSSTPMSIPQSTPPTNGRLSQAAQPFASSPPASTHVATSNLCEVRLVLLCIVTVLKLSLTTSRIVTFARNLWTTPLV